jgi:hypothetical protein
MKETDIMDDFSFYQTLNSSFLISFVCTSRRRAHAVVACCTLTRGDYAATIGAAVSACTVLGAMGGSEADLARANALSLQADALWLKASLTRVNDMSDAFDSE